MKISKKVTGITLAVILAIALSLVISACGSAGEIEQGLINDAKALVGEAKTELSKVEGEIAKIETQLEEEMHAVAVEARSALERAEAAIKNETQKGIDDAKDEIAVLKAEITKLLEKSERLEGEAADEFHKVVKSLESKVKDLENTLKR